MVGRRDEVRETEAEDEELAEVWLRETDEPEVRSIAATRRRGEGTWTWRVHVAAAELAREEPLESDLRAAVDTALRAVVGVETVAEQDREVWVVRGSPSGAALTEAAARAVDELADRLRATYER